MNRILSYRRHLVLVLIVASSAALGMSQEGPMSFEQVAPRSAVTVPNGDFEQGRTVWTESSTNGLTLIRQLNEINIAARSGSWGAVLGIANRELAYIEQTVTVPATATTLSYWYQLGSTDTHLGFDFARIVINGGDIIDEFQLLADENVTNWTLRSADIGPYAGQTVTLRIAAEIDVAEPSTLIIDDVHFTTGAPPNYLFTDGFESGSTLAWSAAVP